MIGKHILSLLAVLTVSIGISQTNNLVIFSEKGNPFYLILNEDTINKIEQSNVKVFNLQSGWQHIVIKTVISNTALTLKDSILLSDKSKYANKEFTYVLLLHENKLKLRFESVSEFSGPETPVVPTAPKEVIALEDNSVYGIVYEVKNGKPVFFNNYNTESSNCKNVLNDKDMKYGLNLLNKSRDDESKFRDLKRIIEFNCYNCNQLKQLLEATAIDMDRLNLAKEAYVHITDKENINVISETFNYEAMKESYEAFLKDQKNVTKQKKMECITPVNKENFEVIFNKIKTSRYESDKLLMAKNLLSENCISTEQTKKIVELFTHDREALEFLKYAYPVITDKEKVKSLTEELQYSGSKEEYLNFIYRHEKH